jgi:hypothetical protein
MSSTKALENQFTLSKIRITNKSDYAVQKCAMFLVVISLPYPTQQIQKF